MTSFKPIIQTLNGDTPQIGKNCFIAPNATLVGDVIIGDDCSVWYQAVLRGDVGKIQIGNASNVQDGVVIHATYKRSNTLIGNEVTIGHSAVIHGCIIHDYVLVGMGAIVMDNAVVESGSIIGAGAVVLENTRIESGSIWAGVPAVKIKEIDPVKSVERLKEQARAYLMYKRWYGE